ncbi:PH domain-containing protein [Polaromonas sp.]|nr:PH domain-containing protein [Candidatus Saccharibacteria bacterium]
MLRLAKFKQTKAPAVKQSQMMLESNLKALGAVAYDLLLPETQALPHLIHGDEQILGIVYGKYKMHINAQKGRGALVATNHRILLVDKKPLFEKVDELAYRVVSGVTYVSVGLTGTVTLHTRMGDISVRTFNHDCANTFVKAVETSIFENPLREAGYDNA